MPDMLVKLYELPDVQICRKQMKEQSIVVRRPQPYEQTNLWNWVSERFSGGWADEVAVSFTHQPVSSFVALDQGKLVGFGAFECTRRNYFGPTGVLPEYRKRGIGNALLIESLYGLWEMGYSYAIVGGAGPVEFYARSVGAQVIEGSVPGIYTAAFTLQDPTP